ncbi:hypothetical protein HF086_001481 [Spodoptera exigua]|uniref:Amidase domain-containing protein n=1 Tax=Spodoptera exigua TaxID=7107 RepID=A0A922M424_SPOEX|nr:hypothetical protein HF086_001481 [Spodoptera exigua]
MEVGVQVVGIVLRLLNFFLAPLFWFRARDSRRLPPVTNPVLLKSAAELADSVRKGEISSEELVTVFINRVKEVNPYLNAVVEERYRAAIEDAKAIDRWIVETKKSGSFEELVKEKPLLGMIPPIPGLSNSVGCLENAGRRATADGGVVSLVKKAGAIPLLVSNTPELCLGWETTNLLRGTTNNPYCLNRTPGGSSGGEEKFKDLEDSVEISVSVFFGMKDIPNLMQDPANPKRDKSLVVELIKYMFGGGSRSLQGLSFSLINRSHLFIPEARSGYYHARANKLREHMEKTLGDNGVLIYPVFIGQAHHHNQVFLKASGVMYTMVFNILGMPATTVPMGLYKGLPVGIQVIAAPHQDRLCLAVAKQLEIGFGGWKPPQ